MGASTGGMRALVVALTASLALISAPRWLAADGEKTDKDNKGGTLEKARERVKDNADPKVRDHRANDGEEEEPEEEQEEECELNEDGECDESLGALIALYIFTSPYWVPSGLIGDWPTPASFNRYTFRSYPYQDGELGQHRIMPAKKTAFSHVASEPYPFQVSLRVLTSYEKNADNLDGQRLRATLRTNWRFNLDAELTRYDEDLGSRTDHLWHWKALATYSFGVSQRWHMITGVGVRGLRFAAGDHHTHFVFRYGLEVLPVRPLHMWVMGEVGGGNGSGSTEIEAGIGAVYNRVELFVGYRRFRLAGIKIDGPEIGLIVWM